MGVQGIVTGGGHMKITVRPIGVLREFVPGRLDALTLEFDSLEVSLQSVCARVGIDPRLVTAVIVNGKALDNRRDLVLHDGDDASLVPYLAGG
jgi:hypothetical protein